MPVAIIIMRTPCTVHVFDTVVAKQMTIDDRVFNGDNREQKKIKIVIRPPSDSLLFRENEQKQKKKTNQSVIYKPETFGNRMREEQLLDIVVLVRHRLVSCTGNIEY